MDRRNFNLRAAALLAALPGTALAQSGSFPNHPMRVIVPQPPGGGFDFVGRLLADRLSKAVSQPVVVENRPGSGTVVGTDTAAKATPDGYSLLVGSVSNIALNPGLYPKLPYDSLRDFEPVGLAVSYSYTLIARKDLPQTSLRDVIAYAKANPGKLSYASGGVGSGQHVLAAVLWKQAGVDIAHIPYKGAQAAYQDLLGGRVDLFFDLSPTARPQVEAGHVRALAVSGAERSPLHPEVPTVTETGVARVALESWFGLFAPAATPPDVLARLRTELQRIVTAPDVMDAFRKAGGKPLNLDVAATRELVRGDVMRWTRLIQDAGIRAE